MTSSYPYLQLSREFELPYSVVLLCLDQLVGGRTPWNGYWWRWAQAEAKKKLGPDYDSFIDKLLSMQ